MVDKKKGLGERIFFGFFGVFWESSITDNTLISTLFLVFLEVSPVYY